MKIRFVNPQRTYKNLKKELDAAYFSVMEKGAFIAQSELAQFEQQLADFVGTHYAVGVSSGYDALYLSLIAAQIGVGDEVIVPAHTFVATTSAVVRVGAKPVLVDVRDDFNIDPECVEKAITKKTKAIIPVHLNGRMAEMNPIINIAQKNKIIVIEDACQSLGATYYGKPAGSIGLTGCWSFYPFKMLGGYGDGGAITTNNKKIADAIRLLRFNGEDRNTGEYHYHGCSSLLDNMQAAFLNIKIKYLPEWIEKRRSIAARYHKGLQGISGLVLPHFPEKEFDDVFQNYVVRSQYGNTFSDYLKLHGIEVLTQFRKPYYTHQGLRLYTKNFPVTDTLSKEVCSLPLYPELKVKEVDYIVQTISTFYQNIKA